MHALVVLGSSFLRLRNSCVRLRVRRDYLGGQSDALLPLAYAPMSDKEVTEIFAKGGLEGFLEVLQSSGI